MFRGRFDHSLDEKGRLAVPARFRDLILKDREDATLVITNFDQCLSAYPLEEWERLEKKVAELPPFDPKVIAFQRYFIAGATECPFDKAGRVLIPASLRQFATIDRDCVIVGQLNKFEIWSTDRWSNTMRQLSDFSTMANTMAELGLRL
jgi:MraZ protein